MKFVKVEEQLLVLHGPLQRLLKWIWLCIPVQDKVCLVVYTSYIAEKNRAAYPA
jgi:hypothetical protein